ncbi:type IV secretory system conjugative DNA transfer family protein [Halorussus aquaticus]|nr:type IV secretory system conjugative DNA transfer family protein [Halorussus aquaticus]
MAETRDAPPVTDDDLAVMLGGVVTNSKRSFDELMQGVMNRIEKVPLDDRLAHLFNHVPQNTTEARIDGDETAPDPEFDFFDVLDEDAVVIFDTSGLRTESRRALTLVLLSNLWTALRRRQRLHTKERDLPEDDYQDNATDDLPLVNLYVEEAAEVAASGLMTDLLAKSRGFHLSVTLAMQFPAQVRNTDTEAYAEILNNISTIITGNVAVDSDLEKRLATEDIPPSEVGNRLRALRRGQWFASLPAGFQDREPRPFLLSSAPLPPGHPEGDDPLTETQSLAFEALLDSVKDRTRLDYGLDFLADGQAQSRPSTTVQAPGSKNGSPATETTNTRVDSALPYTKRLPTCIQYNEDAHAIVCTGCESRHDPSPAGLKRGIKCCSSLDRIDRDKIPICEVSLTLSPQEREESEYSDRQLAFLQVVYAAHQGEYDPEWEYDICWDSMLRLQEYVGIESEAVDELVDDDLLRIDCDHPHRLYTVTADGRSEIQVAHREGIAYGHGVGDLGESSLHRVMVEIGRQYVEDAYANDSDSDVVEVVPYYELDDGHRLDVAGLDADGNVQAVVEAERANHDILRAVPEDYDKMAAFDPEDAIWIVKNRDAAHDVLEALNEPPTGDRRVEKEYSRSSPPRAFRLDAPGCSEIHTLGYVRGSLLDLESP